MIAGLRIPIAPSTRLGPYEIASSQPPPISVVAPMTPPALDHIVTKCLEKDPEHRWQSAQDVATELQWISEAGSQAGVASVVRIERKSRERFAWAAAAFLLVNCPAILPRCGSLGMEPLSQSRSTTRGTVIPSEARSLQCQVTPAGDSSDSAQP